MITYDTLPRNIVKSNMKLRGISSKQMVELLKLKGIEMDVKSFNNKMYRGSFSAVFFIKCLKAMNVKSIELDIFDEESFV